MRQDKNGNFTRADADRSKNPKEQAEIERREKIDDNFTEIDERFIALEKKIDENTVVTTQVRDILTSFRVVGGFAKYLTIIGAFLVMCWHGFLEWRR